MDRAEEAQDLSIATYMSGCSSKLLTSTPNSLPTYSHADDSLSFDSIIPHVLDVAKDAAPSKIKSLLKDLAKLIPQDDLRDVVGDLFVAVTNRPHLKPYIELSCGAIEKLEASGRGCDLLQRFAKCIAVDRPGSSESLMPLERMPFGLIEYQIRFFTSEHVNQVSPQNVICLCCCLCCALLCLLPEELNSLNAVKIALSHSSLFCVNSIFVTGWINVYHNCMYSFLQITFTYTCIY